MLDDPPERGDYHDIAIELNANLYLETACFVILYYDYLLTLAQEIRAYWFRARLSLATVLFFVNRYLILLGHIPIVLRTYESWSPQTCRAVQLYHQIITIVIQILVGVLMILRIYALYERSKRMLAFLLAIAVIIISVGIWSILRSSGTDSLPPYYSIPAWDTQTCIALAPLNNTDATHMAVAWTGLFIFDTLAFVLTIYRMFVVKARSRPAFMRIVLRDGILYYVVLGGTNLSNIMFLFLGTRVLRGINATFANVIATILMSRIMLNLRAPELLLGSRRTSTSNSRAFENGLRPDRMEEDEPIVSTFIDFDMSYPSPTNQPPWTPESQRNFNLAPIYEMDAINHTPSGSEATASTRRGNG